MELKKKINREVKLALDKTNSPINKTTSLLITYEIGIDNRPLEIWIESNLDDFVVRFLKLNLMQDTCWQAGLKEGIPVNSMVTLEMQYDPDKGILTSESTFHVDDHRKSVFGNKDHYHIDDNSILSILEKTSSNQNGIVVDVTGSMSPYLVQALIWVEKEINTGKVNSISFFNDGNFTPDPLKKIGKTGGIFHVQQKKDFDDIVETAITAMLSFPATVNRCLMRDLNMYQTCFALWECPTTSEREMLFALWIDLESNVFFKIN